MKLNGVIFSFFFIFCSVQISYAQSNQHLIIAYIQDQFMEYPYFWSFVIGIFAYLSWDAFLRRKCPKCRSLEYHEINRVILDRYSEKRGRAEKGTVGTRKYVKIYERDVRITISDVTFHCGKCHNEWSERIRNEEKGPERVVSDNS